MNHRYQQPSKIFLNKLNITRIYTLRNPIKTVGKVKFKINIDKYVWVKGILQSWLLLIFNYLITEGMT